MEPLATERQFFRALLEAKLESLDQVLAGDFLLIDVMSGSEISKPALLGAVGSGQLKFEVVEVVESRVRLYSGTAMSTDARKCGGVSAKHSAPLTAETSISASSSRTAGGWSQRKRVPRKLTVRNL